MLRQFQVLAVNEVDWAFRLTQPISSRPDYIHTEERVQYQQVVVNVQGVPYDETAYYQELYELSLQQGVTILSEDLDKTIPPERFQALQKMYELVQKQPTLSLNRFVAFLDAEHLLPRYQNEWQRELRLQFITILQQFEQDKGTRYTHPDFRRLLLDLIKWMWNHIDPWLKQFDMVTATPSIVWFGALTTSQHYFLRYCINCGFDVALITPNEAAVIVPAMSVVRYPTMQADTQFPTAPPKQQTTVAYGAQREISTILGGEDGYLAPWSLREHEAHGITLRTTYNEIEILSEQRALVRPGFEVKQHQVTIPVLFTKISGVTLDEASYWAQIHRLVALDHATLIEEFPFQEENRANNQYHYTQALGRDGKLSIDKMLASNWWQHAHLHDGVQRSIAAAMIRLCEAPRLKRLVGETDDALRLYTFSQAMQMPRTVGALLQRYDYTQDVPKIILYNNEINGELSRADAAMLLMLNELGLDIVLFNPAGLNDMERYVDKAQFDHHLLDEMRFNYAYRAPQTKSSLTDVFKGFLGFRRD